MNVVIRHCTFHLLSLQTVRSHDAKKKKDSIGVQVSSVQNYATPTLICQVTLESPMCPAPNNVCHDTCHSPGQKCIASRKCDTFVTVIRDAMYLVPGVQRDLRHCCARCLHVCTRTM